MIVGQAFIAEPLRTEDAWRVRRTFDGQAVLYRVTQAEAEAFVKRSNDIKAVITEATDGNV